MKFSTRQLVTLAVFGTLWGVVEMSFGSVLKSLQIPFSGAVLASIGLLIVMVARLFVPVRGSSLFVGVIAMLLKLFSIGTIIIGPMFGIVTEAILAELIFSTTRRQNRALFVLVGGLGVLWTLAQPFVTGLLFFGRAPFVVWLDMIDNGARMLGLSGQVIWLVLAALVAVHLILGGVAGWLAWDVGRQLQKRMGQTLEYSGA
jgi:ABC-type thiamin/hydroxymethylpyrimidine transport system permease subunit